LLEGDFILNNFSFHLLAEFYNNHCKQGILGMLKLHLKIQLEVAFVLGLRDRIRQDSGQPGVSQSLIHAIPIDNASGEQPLNK